jgi:dipeptidyl aminopeptidase/acylaminoacyl peptidase
MTSLSRISTGLAAAWAGLLLFTGQAAAAPLEIYGRLPLMEDVRLSPDGTMIAVAMTDGENRVIVIRSLADNKVVGGVRAGETKVRDIRWAGSDYLLVTTSQTALVRDLIGPRREYMITIVYDLATKRQRGLMDRTENSMNVVLSLPRVRMFEGELVAIVEGVNFVENQGRVGLFRVKLKSGATRTIEEGAQDTDDWVIGADGLAAAQTEYDQKSGSWKLRLKSGRSWRTVEEATLLIDRPWLGGLGRDGKSVLVGFTGEDGKPLLQAYAPDGDEPTTTTALYDDLIHDPISWALIGSSGLVDDTYRYSFYDPRDDAAWKGVVKAYPPTDRVHLISWSDDRRKIVVLVDSPVDGPAYALVDLDKKAATWLGDQYAALRPSDISEVRAISYKAADGLTVTGYLTLPRGKAAKGLPLVVLPHGGPATRDEPRFDWWAQALASRGYAVLQPNFRGSAGLGVEFLEAGYGEWGRKMQSDLSDGVRDLAARGLIDPRRVCIVGASYGGYAALAGVTLDTGVYRCAAAVAGVYDLRRFLEAERQAYGSTENNALRYWSRFLGVDGRKDPDLDALSPAKLAARADAPVLLIHGKDDTVVLYEQSRIMADALKKAGKPVELVTLHGEDHWLSRGDTRLQMLTAVVAFLEKHNPPE